MRIHTHTYVNTMWSFQQLGLHLISVSLVASIWIYEPLRLQPHFGCWYRFICTHMCVQAHTHTFSVYPWIFLRHEWTKPWETRFDFINNPILEQEVGLETPPILSYPVILWFCNKSENASVYNKQLMQFNVFFPFLRFSKHEVVQLAPTGSSFSVYREN